MFDDIDATEFVSSSADQRVHAVVVAGALRSIQVSRSLISPDTSDALESSICQAINQSMNDYLDAISEKLMAEEILSFL